MLVVSSNYFYVCPLCGYSIASDESVSDKKVQKQMINGAPRITDTKDHESLFGNYGCNNRELVKRRLHHVFNTDVAKITFGCYTGDYNTMISVMYAILNAIALELNIERRDIKACLSPTVVNRALSYSIIIYDSVPGGAGHSRRLVTEDGSALYNIIESAYNRMVSCNCDPSCYNCLRSYENQKIHDKLDRNLAAGFL